MIKKIRFKNNDYSYLSDESEELKELLDISTLNILLGPNNSGKSRFMRSLFSEGFEYYGEFNSKYQDKQIDLEVFESAYNKILPIIDKYPDLKEDFYDDCHKSLSRRFDNIESIVNNIIYVRDGVLDGNNFDVSKLQQYVKDLQKVDSHNLERDSIEIVYIPMLRSLRTISLESEDENVDPFLKRTLLDYFPNFKLNGKEIANDENHNFTVFTGQSLYDQVRDMLLGHSHERESIREYEHFLSKTFFQDQEVNLIPKIKSDVLSLRIGNEEHHIYDLGDGLQSIITMTFPLFTGPKILFIEEPEQTLHPGMQRKLLKAFKDSSSQIFFTTHSNHFLDLSLDDENVSYYSVSKNTEGKAPWDTPFFVKNITPNKNILNLLGVRNSSVFLSNCIIWVEGISDRIYLKKFLELYLKDDTKIKFEEDINFTILEYAGGNVTHFNFDDVDANDETINVSSISKNNFLVADNDGYNLEYLEDVKDDDDSKLVRLKEFHKLLNENFWAEHYEIENLVPYRVYSKYFSSLEDIPNKKWKTRDSFESQELFESLIETTPVGTVIKDCFVESKQNPETKQFSKKDISCIGSKKELSIQLTNLMNDIKFEELPVQAKKLTEKLYQFIEVHNVE